MNLGYYCPPSLWNDRSVAIFSLPQLFGTHSLFYATTPSAPSWTNNVLSCPVAFLGGRQSYSGPNNAFPDRRSLKLVFWRRGQNQEPLLLPVPPRSSQELAVFNLLSGSIGVYFNSPQVKSLIFFLLAIGREHLLQLSVLRVRLVEEQGSVWVVIIKEMAVDRFIRLAIGRKEVLELVI